MISTNLEKARNLITPSREDILRRDYSVKKFWEDNRILLSEAWKEWENIECDKSTIQLNELIDLNLKTRVEQAWENPERENEVKQLLQEVSPGVFQFQFLNVEKIVELRNYLEKADLANIPTRPPYGIVLNRKGAMLDKRSEGYLAAPAFQAFYQEALDKYMRPIARLLFPEIIGYDGQTFGFSIQYKPEKDTSIRMHTDASSVTLNINLNLPDEVYSGSEVDFHDPLQGKINRLKFKPGVAMIHRGSVAHAAQPITSGERTNLVLWLYGDKMQIPRFAKTDLIVEPKKRWTIPSNQPDSYAPF